MSKKTFVVLIGKCKACGKTIGIEKTDGIKGKLTEPPDAKGQLHTEAPAMLKDQTGGQEPLKGMIKS